MDFPLSPGEARPAALAWISLRSSGQLFAKLLETSPKVDMDTTAAALPAFLAFLLLSPWPLLGSAQGQFSAGEWPRWLPPILGSGGVEWLLARAGG